MNDSMNTLIVVAAIALYKNKSAVAAIAYMIRNGMDIMEAVDLLALYDRFDDACKAGTLY